MKIVHVLPALTKGGAERVMLDLANQAVKEGHNVSVVAAFPVDSTVLRDELHKSIDVRYVSSPLRSKFAGYLFLLPWLVQNRNFLAEQDVLHCHLTFGSVFGTAEMFLRMLTGTSKPTIVETYHAVGMLISTLRRWAHAQLAAKKDALAFMAEDRYWREFAANRPALLTRIILNGATEVKDWSQDPARKHEYRREVGISDDCRFVIGTVGMMRKERRPSDFIAIFAEVACTIGPTVSFVFAGGGSELERMRELVKEQGLEEQVYLPGLAVDPSLPLSIIDLYITLNVGPITGIAALEAALVGRPVIGIQMLEEYQPGENDWIESSADLSTVADLAVRLFRSPQELQALAERQQGHARKNHTVEAMASSYYLLYQDAIKRRNSAKNNRNSRIN